MYVIANVILTDNSQTSEGKHTLNSSFTNISLHITFSMIQIQANIFIIAIVEILCSTCANVINMSMYERDILYICHVPLKTSVIIAWPVMRQCPYPPDSCD